MFIFIEDCFSIVFRSNKQCFLVKIANYIFGAVSIMVVT